MGSRAGVASSSTESLVLVPESGASSSTESGVPAASAGDMGATEQLPSRNAETPAPRAEPEPEAPTATEPEVPTGATPCPDEVEEGAQAIANALSTVTELIHEVGGAHGWDVLRHALVQRTLQELVQAVGSWPESDWLCIWPTTAGCGAG